MEVCHTETRWLFVETGGDLTSIVTATIPWCLNQTPSVLLGQEFAQIRVVTHWAGLVVLQRVQVLQSHDGCFTQPHGTVHRIRLQRVLYAQFEQPNAEEINLRFSCVQNEHRFRHVKLILTVWENEQLARPVVHEEGPRSGTWQVSQVKWNIRHMTSDIIKFSTNNIKGSMLAQTKKCLS